MPDEEHVKCCPLHMKPQMVVKSDATGTFFDIVACVKGMLDGIEIVACVKGMLDGIERAVSALPAGLVFWNHCWAAGVLRL